MAPSSAFATILTRSFLLLATKEAILSTSASASPSLGAPTAFATTAFQRRLSSRALSSPLRLRGGGPASIRRPGSVSSRHRAGVNGSLSSFSSSSSNDDDYGEEPRTGWLHNTKPKHSSASDTERNNPARMRLAIEKMRDYRRHRIADPPSLHPCGDDRRMMVTEHRIRVPLNHSDFGEGAARGSGGGIVPVDGIADKFYNGDVDLVQSPTVDVYFTIIELVSSSQDEAFFELLSDPTLSPRQRAERYLRGHSSEDSRESTSLSSSIASAVDPSRTIIYLQGGPGFGCATPVTGLSLASSTSSWAAQALLGGITNSEGKSFQRVLLMDQRGTGRSSPITKQTLRRLFPDLFLLDDEDEAGVTGSGGGAIGDIDLDSNTQSFRKNESPAMQLNRAKVSKALEEATEYLSKFRADAIVRDAEWIREALVSPAGMSDPDVVLGPSPPRPWGAALGQSFGGFCIMTYLSSIRHPPKICLLTGGIAPMNTPVREVYDRLWLRVRERSRRYYEQYPGDVERVKKIIRFLENPPSKASVTLPSGGILTARRFLQLGLGLGGTSGASFVNLHSIISSAFLDDDSDSETAALSKVFLKRIDAEQSFDDAPLYFLLHESIYADGPSAGAMNWAAHSSLEAYLQSNPEFDYRITSSADSKDPILFSGEMVFPYMAHGDFADISGNGMRLLSESLASKDDWLPLFDESNMRSALLGGKTKAAAAVYYEDMYVDFDCCMKLVQRGMPLEGVKVWVTNEYQHSGLRDDGASIFKKIMAMAKGAINVPS